MRTKLAFVEVCLIAASEMQPQSVPEGYERVLGYQRLTPGFYERITGREAHREAGEAAQAVASDNED